MKPLSELTEEDLARLARQAEGALPDAPPWLVESALAMWRAPVAKPPLGRRIAAVLGFDSWAVQPALSLRSASPVLRHLLFNAGDRDIDLRVSPAAGAAGRFSIAGQVLGPGDDGEVSLSRSGEVLARARLDDFGEFGFADLAQGTYGLAVQFGDDSVVLPDLDVGGAPP